jgi:hypothetical protein
VQLLYNLKVLLLKLSLLFLLIVRVQLLVVHLVDEHTLHLSLLYGLLVLNQLADLFSFLRTVGCLVGLLLLYLVKHFPLPCFLHLLFQDLFGVLPLLKFLALHLFVVEVARGYLLVVRVQIPFGCLLVAQQL